MSKSVKKITIDALPVSSSLTDEDIFIKSNQIGTSSVTAKVIAEYIKKNEIGEKNVQSDWTETDTSSAAYIKNKPTAMVADGGNADTVNNHTVESDVPANAEFTDTVYTHPDSSVTPGTYKSVTVDKQGHVTGGSNPTTLSEYGIADAATKAQGEKADTAVQSVKIGTTEYKSGTIAVLPDYPTALPASDVYEWAKAETKPVYTASEVGADELGSANIAYENAKSYTDDRIADLINGAPATLDTLGEIAQAIQENGDVIGTKIDAVNGDETYIDTSQSGTTVTISHTNISKTDSTSTAFPTYGGAFTAVKSVTSDSKGHITGVDTETVTLPAAPTTISGNAGTATKLAAAKTIRTNLSSTSAASFDGSANVTPGVTGTLAVGNGGTGQTTANAAANAFVNSLTTNETTPADTDYLISQYPNGGTTTTTYHRKPMSAIWNYIKSKISSVLKLTASEYGGNAATATSAATATKLGNDTVGGTAKPIYLNSGTATALSSTIGSATQPVYMKAGTITKCSYTLGKSVPSDAVFTDSSHVGYGTCSTAAATAAKIVTLNTDNFELITGSRITVHFTYTNTASNPTLNVNDTGNIQIKVANKVLTTSGSLRVAGYASIPITYVYDGTYWVFAGWGWDHNNTYSAATTSTDGLMTSTDKTKLDSIAESADAVSFTQSLTSGTEVGTITINGTATKLYCQTNTNTDTKVTNTLATTTKAYITGTTSTSTNTGTQVFDTGVYLDTTAGQLTATTFKGALSGNAATATTASKLGSSTVGSGTKPIYLSGGIATASASSVGSSAKPIYMNQGTLTACSSTVGGTDTPVYLNAGTITSTGKSFSNYLPLAGGILKGHVNVNANRSYVLGGTGKNWLSIYVENIVSETGLYLKSSTGLAQVCASYLSVNNYTGTSYAPCYASAYNTSSSKRVKNNIVPLSDEDAKKLLKVDVVTYDYNGLTGDDKGQVGIIAEDLYCLYPNVVTGNVECKDDDIDSIRHIGIDYSKMVPYLIRMVQIQQENINELKETIAQQRELVNDILNKIDVTE